MWGNILTHMGVHHINKGLSVPLLLLQANTISSIQCIANFISSLDLDYYSLKIWPSLYLPCKCWPPSLVLNISCVSLHQGGDPFHLRHHRLFFSQVRGVQWMLGFAQCVSSQYGITLTVQQVLLIMLVIGARPIFGRICLQYRILPQLEMIRLVGHDLLLLALLCHCHFDQASDNQTKLSSQH